MLKKQKLLSSFLIVLVLALVAIPMPANAEEEKITLEQAVTIVKQVVVIPENFKDFTYSFDSYGEQANWNLNWSDQAGGAGGLNVAVSSRNGDIVNYNYWNNVQPQGAEISLAEAQKIAEAKIIQLVPLKHEQMKLIPVANQLIALNYKPNYSFQWQRYANGVPVSNNYAGMEINARSGELMSYYLNWTEGVVPEIANVVSKEQAIKAFRDAGVIELSYLLPYKPQPIDSSKRSIDAKLVARITNPHGGAIDANSGQLLQLAPGEYLNNDFNTYAMAGAMRENSKAANDEGAVNLTPQEIAELNKNSQILSQDNAIKALQKYFTLPATARLTSFNLNQDWSDKDKKLWYFNWEVADQSLSISASIDANSGRVYHYSCWNRLDKEATIGRAEAQTVAEDLIKKIEPQLFSSLRLEKNADNQVIPLMKDKTIAPAPREHSFEFTRLVNGIPCNGQSIGITVSGVDKSIIGYNLNWNDWNFVDPSKAMSLSKLNDQWLAKAPLTLCYAVAYNKDNYSRIIPVYVPIDLANRNAFACIDAVSGTPLGSDGNVIIDYQGQSAFSDISGHFAEKEIRALGQARIVVANGGQFRPDESIIWADFLRILWGAFNGSWDIANLSDQEILRYCVNAGYVSSDTDIKAKVTHAQALKVVIKAMRLDKIAAQSDIFADVKAEDKSITPDLRGYVAIAKGLNTFYMPDAFNADTETSRGEAAYLIVRSIEKVQS